MNCTPCTLSGFSVNIWQLLLRESRQAVSSQAPFRRKLRSSWWCLTSILRSLSDMMNFNYNRALLDWHSFTSQTYWRLSRRWRTHGVHLDMDCPVDFWRRPKDRCYATDERWRWEYRKTPITQTQSRWLEALECKKKGNQHMPYQYVFVKDSK